MKCKLGRRMEEFLPKSKFKVVANGGISGDEDVLSGVPHGVVLASILFIMISNLDKQVNKI